MEFLKKIWKKIKKDPINFITVIISIVGIILYTVRLVIEVKNKTEISVLLEMSANYVTIISCIIVLIQLFAFVDDAKHKELRCRKEAALDIAQRYAEGLLDNISLIQNVMSIYFDKCDYTRLEKILSEIDIDRFTRKGMDKISNPEFKRYSKIFSGKLDIPLEILIDQSLVFNSFDLSILNSQDSKLHKTIANRRFTSIVIDTMNTLEYFAMSVNQNIAESDMLFSSLHQTFLKFVRYVYPRVCYLNSEEEVFYPNVIRLYRSWQKKLDDIEKEKEDEAKRTEELISKKYYSKKTL